GASDGYPAGTRFGPANCESRGQLLSARFSTSGPHGPVLSARGIGTAAVTYAVSRDPAGTEGRRPGTGTYPPERPADSADSRRRNRFPEPDEERRRDIARSAGCRSRIPGMGTACRFLYWSQPARHPGTPGTKLGGLPGSGCADIAN